MTRSIKFTLELPLDHAGDDSWERDDGGPMGHDVRVRGDDVWLHVQGFTRDGLHEIPLVRRDGEGEIVETILIAMRHHHHSSKQGASTSG